MSERSKRLMTIRRLINNKIISSQEELLSLLEGEGFTMTQATLSRDLKYLKVAKMPDNEKGYIYMLTEERYGENASSDNVQLSGFISLNFAQGMAILRTLPGHAGSVAYSLDNLNSYEIVGTIAGDDTILIIPRDGVSKNDLVNLLKIRLPGFTETVVQ